MVNIRAYIWPHSATPLGDIRQMGAGQEVVIYAGSEGRKDWSRYVSAIADAVSSGADVRWVR